MTLTQLIEAHEQRQARKIAETPAAAVLTPRGHAVVAARRFARAPAALDDPNEILVVLFKTVNGFTDQNGHHFSLMVSVPPSRDPQLA